MNNYKYYEIPVCYMTSGLQLRLPVHEFTGTVGPVIGITAGIHGDETIGVEIARRLVENLRSCDIKGTIRIMSVANPLAFEFALRNTPIDQSNLNRIIPASKDGGITERIADVIVNEFLENLDAYVDIHAGGQDPVVDYVYIVNDRDFCKSMLSKVLYDPISDSSGSTPEYIRKKGIPMALLEFGGGPNYECYIAKGVKGIMNMLKYNKAIPGEYERRDDQVVVNYMQHVDAHHGGLFVPMLTYEIMNTVIEGDIVLGRVYNPMTLELLEELRTPYDRNLIILMRGNTNRILPGDYSFMISDMDKAERI